MQTLKELHAQAATKHGLDAVRQKLRAFYKRLLKKPKQTPDESLDGQIIEHLNLVAKTNWQLGSSAKNLINALVKQGFTLDNFKQVHNSKAKEWGSNTEMSKYLRPSTLYRPKSFVKYLEEAQHQRKVDFAPSNAKKW